jgi:speckle-type POZ protein
MAAPTTSKNNSPPATRTASTCTVEKARGTHTFKITDYSLHKGIGVGKCIRSATFTVGGYQWCIRYYPDDVWPTTRKPTNRIVVYLELVSSKAEVRAHMDFRLVDHATGKSTPMHPVPLPVLWFKSAGLSKANDVKGTYSLMTKRQLEASSYLWDDCLVIECNLTVIANEPTVEVTSPPPELCCRVPVPPPSSDVAKHLRELVKEKRGTDVTFRVKGDVFFAHKTILAMQSPVFRAQFFLDGPIMAAAAEEESSAGAAGRSVVDVEDMDPEAFGALILFIYTDATPPAMHDDEDVEACRGMANQLLVAADRYAIERLKLICEDVLCRSLDVETVAATLALAEQCHCSSLRDACVELVSSTSRIGKVVASQGYSRLRKGSPAVVVGMLEKVITKWMHNSKRL